MRKTLLFLPALLGLLACTDFPSRFDRLDGEKIRPLAVICEPVDASSGDTVTVRLVADFPTGVPSIQWTAALDFKEDPFANDAYEREIRDLRTLGYRDLSGVDNGLFFSFVVPRDVFSYSSDFTTRKTLLVQLSGLDPADADRILFVLDSVPPGSPLPPEAAPFQFFLSFIGCRIKLRAHMEQGIELDVTKLLAVRFGRKFNSTDVNSNPPRPRYLEIVKVNGEGVQTLDATNEGKIHSRTLLQIMPDGLFPDRGAHLPPADTVLIEPGYSYFISADTAGQPPQAYSYLSLSGGGFNARPDTETLAFNFFCQNLGEQPGMERDSLVVLSSGPFSFGAGRPFLPPVDTAMHDFRFHLVVSDARANDPLDASGKAYIWAQGSFRYSAEYARRNSK